MTNCKEAAEYYRQKKIAEIELKPCPFCGGEAMLMQIPYNTEEEQAMHPRWRWDFPGTWFVGCDTEMCYGNINNMAMVFLNMKHAAEIWNQRAGEQE